MLGADAASGDFFTAVGGHGAWGYESHGVNRGQWQKHKLINSIRIFQ